MICYSCDFYDASVDACNADEHCYTEGIENSRKDLAKEIEYCLHSGMGKKKSLEHLLKICKRGE